jgi:molybdate transport system substrate-binding protein
VNAVLARPPVLRSRSTATRCAALALAAAACGRGGGAGSGTHDGAPLRVAAAADLAVAFEELGKEFERTTGKPVVFTFGSTGLLARQIEEGAPFDVFAAANVSFADEAVASGACDGASKRLYAQGRLVLWAKQKGTLPARLDGLRDARFAKIALANPEHAPYGKAAREALERAGVWDAVHARAVYGDNVQQALMFAQTGNVDVAIVALSLAIAAGGDVLPIDGALHAPLEQALVVCAGKRPAAKTREARSFVAFVSSPAARATMRRYGFLLPGETALASPPP